MLNNLREMIREWKEDPRFEESDRGRFVLMALLKEGPLTLEELEKKSFLFVSQFGVRHRHVHKKPRGGDIFDVRAEADSLVDRNMVLRTGNTYDLTEEGRKTAEKSVQIIERGARWVKKNVLNPRATARNTVFADFFLAFMKLTAGMISGSVGLLADGADAAVDTVSASVVWAGLKMKKELLGTVVIIAMMVATGVSIGYESVSKIICVAYGTVEPISHPYLVIGTETIALLAASLLCLYQGFVGKEYGSLALISQSIDSKNHIYVATAVISGAVFSIFGIYFVDAVIGIYVSGKILLDGFRLSKEVISSARGEEPDFSKYKMLFEKYWQVDTLDSYRLWALYSLKNENMERKELIAALEETFKQTYVPILTEFRFNTARGFDFENEFDTVVEPLLEEGFVARKDGVLKITKAGKNYVNSTLKGMRYHQIA
jgi:cation diffusion facilitator family transporter